MLGRGWIIISESKNPKKPEYFESSNLTVITVFHDDELNEIDKSNLYRDVWAWFEKRCLPPKGLIID